MFNSNYFLSLGTQTLIYVMLAVSLNIMLGYIGLISFGHAAFFGVGAYTSGLLTYHFDIPFYIGFLVAVLLCLILGAIVGLMTLKLSGVYFAIITLAFAEIIRVLVLNLVDITRGPLGLSVPKIEVSFIGYNLFVYYGIFLVLMAVLYFVHSLIGSPLGKKFILLRENEELAISAGINPFKTKVIGVIISSGIAGIAGVCYAYSYLFLNPNILGLHYTTIALLMVIVGGKGTFIGPIFGAVVFSLLPEGLRFLDSSVSMVIFGLLLLICIILIPKGIVDLFSKMFRQFSLHPKKNQLNMKDEHKMTGS